MNEVDKIDQNKNYKIKIILDNGHEQSINEMEL